MTQTPLTAWIEGIGFLAPGMPDWPTARAILRGEQAWENAPSVLPAPAILPPAERRRASRVVKLTLAVGLEAAAHAGADVSTLATVFSASGADGHNCHAICEQLATDDRQISPTRFHNSVHNAAAGYWGIATKAMAPCQVICAYDAGFGAGLLDALAQVALDRQTTLLIAYDSEYPEPLFATRPVPDVAGVGLVLAPEKSERSLARITVQPSTAPAEAMADAELDVQRNAIPALRALPMLRRLANGEGGPVGVDYLPPMQLEIDLQPC
ncbi:beta-ketoacyl synthase chain length factor [Azonexus sp. IMCC34839]|uniref:beta-ketoacyl synthase chain length factor n=1 Tax=Azonexus sp. IMCC34839 TaxID=3133695 RepID=UPI00399B1955